MTSRKYHGAALAYLRAGSAVLEQGTLRGMSFHERQSLHDLRCFVVTFSRCFPYITIVWRHGGHIGPQGESLVDLIWFTSPTISRCRSFAAAQCSNRTSLIPPPSISEPSSSLPYMWRDHVHRPTYLPVALFITFLKMALRCGPGEVLEGGAAVRHRDCNCSITCRAAGMSSSGRSQQK